MFTDLDFYDAWVQFYGLPEHRTHPTEAQLSRWRGRLPDLLLRHWAERGWGSHGDGQYWLCDPDLLRPVMEEVFAGDPQHSPDDLIPLGYNALGMIDVFMGQGRTMTVDLVFGTVRWRDQSMGEDGAPRSDYRVLYGPLSLGAERLNRQDENGRPIFPWALENLGPLDPGEIYGFVPAYGASQC